MGKDEPVMSIDSLEKAMPVTVAILVNAHIILRGSDQRLSDDDARVAVLQLFKDYLLDIHALAQTARDRPSRE